MYYGSGTVDRIASRQPADAAGAGQMLNVQYGSTCLHEMTSWPPSEKYGIMSEIKTLSTDVYLLEEQSWQISSRFDLKRWSLRPFSQECHPNKKNEMNSDMRLDSDVKTLLLLLLPLPIHSFSGLKTQCFGSFHQTAVDTC